MSLPTYNPSYVTRGPHLVCMVKLLVVNISPCRDCTRVGQGAAILLRYGIYHGSLAQYHQRYRERATIGRQLPINESFTTNQSGKLMNKWYQHLKYRNLTKIANQADSFY